MTDITRYFKPQGSEAVGPATTPIKRTANNASPGKSKGLFSGSSTPSPPVRRNSLFGEIDESSPPPPPKASPQNKSPSKKHIHTPLVNATGDEPAHGSLFNINVSEPCADLVSPRFDPGLFDFSEYVPTGQKDCDSTLFRLLVEVLKKAEEAFCSGIGSRKYLQVVLANFFRVLIYYRPNDVVPAVYILQNQIAPEYEEHDIGVGDALLVKCLAEAFSKSETTIKSLLNKHEDLGIVASLNSCTSQTLIKLPNHTLAGVLAQIRSLAKLTGKNAKNKKKDIIKKMILAADHEEAKYIVRCLEEKLRVGVNSHTIFQCLADACYLTRPSREGGVAAIGDVRTSGLRVDYTIEDMEKAVKTAITLSPCIDKVVGHLLSGDDVKALLEHCKITPGIPIRPMLAKAVNKTSEIVAAIGGEDIPFICEYKYDGERVQLHMLKDRSIFLFSRNMERLCAKYPDVKANFLQCVDPSVENCILDCEVVAHDKSTGKILSFQTLSTRKRKYADVNNIEIPVVIYPFDVLYLNNESLTTMPLKQRKIRLKEVVHEREGLLKHSETRYMNSLDDVDEFLRQAVADSCEGLMIKTLGEGSTYEPQKRSVNWLKFKKDYIEGLADSIDLVPIGAYLGKGKRTSIYGSYLLAVYDPVLDTFQSVCKTGTGFTDEVLKNLFQVLQEFTIEKKDPSFQVSDKMEPDVWFKPVKVWECRAADLSLSPVHTAANHLIAENHNEQGSGASRGIGLRFPRFVRAREDKEPRDATSSRQILDMYEAQFNKG